MLRRMSPFPLNIQCVNSPSHHAKSWMVIINILILIYVFRFMYLTWCTNYSHPHISCKESRYYYYTWSEETVNWHFLRSQRQQILVSWLKIPNFRASSFSVSEADWELWHVDLFSWGSARLWCCDKDEIDEVLNQAVRVVFQLSLEGRYWRKCSLEIKAEYDMKEMMRETGPGAVLQNYGMQKIKQAVSFQGSECQTHHCNSHCRVC